MTYEQATKYLYEQLPVFHRIGAAAYKTDLGNTVKLMESLDNPQNSFHSVHVAGTNGKGSCSHMLASIIMASGHKTGLHTSPHLVDLRERIMIDGKMCDKNYVIGFIKRYDAILKTIEPSFFELMVAMAFNYFRTKKTDTAVVEVGMGGRLDSTNILSPDCCLITNISYDHQQFLGDTLPKIAAEKAGIIKQNTPVVISQTQDETTEVFLNKAKQMNAPIFFADKDYKISRVGECVYDIYRGGEVFLSKLKCPLGGIYQQKNLLGVIRTVEVLNSLDRYNIDKEAIRYGIEHLQEGFTLRGRWQKLSDKPLTICDTGHNEDGLSYVIEQLKSLKKTRINFVFGVVNDKEIDKEIEMLPDNAVYYLCKADIPRGLPVEILAEKFEKHKLPNRAFTCVKDAYLQARKDALKDGAMVFIGGSTYTVAELISSLGL